MLLKGKLAAMRGAAARCNVRPVLSYGSRCRHIMVRVAAIEEASPQAQTAVEPTSAVEPVEEQPTQQAAAIAEIDEPEELELLELEENQLDALGWMLTHNEQEQETDLDEMVDYDEFGDDEYTDEVYNEVERMLNSGLGNDLRIGDRVVGTVYQVDDEGAYVEIGQKASGFVPLAECSFAKLKTPLEVLRVGMRREFIVVDREDEYGQIVLSLAAIEATVFWQRIRQFHEEQHTVHVKVESANKGGLLVTYGPYEGFLPVSQFGSAISVDNMEQLIGSTIPVTFLDVDEERERLVFSSLKTGAGVAAKQAALKIGDVEDGVVQSVKPYGAFVDIGGASGLLHISQISHMRVTDVTKVIREGDRLKVMVLGIDRERGRVTLSIKKLEQNEGDFLKDPQLVWDNAEKAAAEFQQRLADASAQIFGAQNQAALTDPNMM